jgi:hypothetical protein
MLIALGLVVIGAFSGQAAIPGTGDPKVYTEIDYAKDLLAFQQRALPQAYESAGQRDAKWDATVTKLLNGMAAFLTDKAVHERAQVPAPPRDELEKDAKAALDAGCDDPLVVYCYGVLLDERNAKDEARPFLERAAAAMPASHYPIIRAVYANERLIWHLDPKKNAADVEKYWKLEQDEWLAVFAAGDLKGFDRRVYYDNFAPIMQTKPFEDRRMFYERLKELKAEPWITNMIGGRFHIDAAWEARGSGWANSVTEEGWKQFNAHLSASYECLKKAYELEPKYPEAATSMITVMMGGSAHAADENPRVWFDRAVQGQFDYADAYAFLFSAMMPRWGGSHEMILAFGQECADTKRYDTCVPYQFVVAAKTVADDMGGRPGVFTEPAVYKTACEVLDGYAASPREANSREWYQAYKVGIQYQAGKFTDALATLKQMRTDRPHMDETYQGLHAACQVPSRVLAAVPLLGGEHAAELKTAEESAAAGKFDDAIKTYDALATKMKADEPGATFARKRLQELKWQKSFAAGEEVSIQPDAKLAGWYRVGGNWTVDSDGTLVGESDEGALMLLCGCNFGRRYEISYALEFDMSDPHTSFSPGTVVNYSSWERAQGIYLGAPWHKMFFAQGKQGMPMDIPFTGNDRVDISVWDGLAGISMNGNPPVGVQIQYEGGPEPRRAFVGVGAWEFSLHAGKKVRIKDLKIRKLTDAPEFARQRPGRL